jgi:long-chain fatty acid transport protein
VALQLHPTLSLAAGPTFNLSTIRFRRGIAAPGDKFEYKGWGAGYGLSSGLLWKPHEKWAFGINYQGPTEITYSGRSKARPYTPSESTEADLPFPQFIMAGLSYRPNRNWNLEIAVDWCDWDTLDTVSFEKDSGNAPFPFHWESSFMYHFGATRYLPRGYSLSAGYFYSEHSVPDRHFNPAVPDADQHILSLGIGRQGERWSWSAAYQILFSDWRTVRDSRSTSLIGESADGKYRIFNNALNVSLGYRF